VDELYAVKESLMGTQHPIKISAPLSSALQHPARFSARWSADGRWLLFGSTEKNDTVSTSYYAVRLDRGIPEAPVLVSLPSMPAVRDMLWSPSGHELLFKGVEGSLYWLHLSDAGAVPVQLNPWTIPIRSAIWATNDAIVYSAKSGVYQVSVGADPAPTSSPFRSNEDPWSPDIFWASSDGRWVILLADDRRVLLGDRSTGKFQRIGAAALDPSRISWRFSPDSQYLVYAAAEQVAGQTEVYLMDLARSTRTTIATTEIDSASALNTWAPDSTFFTYLDSANSHEQGDGRLTVYNVRTKQIWGTNFDRKIHDGIAGFGREGNDILYSTQRLPGEPTQLVGIDQGGNSKEYDEDAAGRPYSGAEFAKDGSAALYCTSVIVGSEWVNDMVYRDLRGPFTRSVRVPGEGSSYGCSKGFGATSKGFAYFRWASDGSQILYWVDISKQVMSKPIKISGDGRVSQLIWQPVTAK